jgi:5'-methylthioadenosine phosphorylase
VIGMTNMPEAKLAREAEICYCTIAMVTDYDSWHPEDAWLSRCRQGDRGEKANSGNAKRLVTRIAPDFPRAHAGLPVGSDRALDFAIMTAPEKRDPAMLMAKLAAVAGRVLKG